MILFFLEPRSWCPKQTLDCAITGPEQLLKIKTLTCTNSLNQLLTSDIWIWNQVSSFVFSANEVLIAHGLNAVSLVLIRTAGSHWKFLQLLKIKLHSICQKKNTVETNWCQSGRSHLREHSATFFAPSWTLLRKSSGCWTTSDLSRSFFWALSRRRWPIMCRWVRLVACDCALQDYTSLLKWILNFISLILDFRWRIMCRWTRLLACDCAKLLHPLHLKFSPKIEITKVGIKKIK